MRAPVNKELKKLLDNAPNMIIRGAIPIQDKEIFSFIQNLPFKEFFTQNDDKSMDIGIQQQFLDFIPQWILSTKLNKISGLDRYPIKRLTSGNTQVFDDFYIRYSTRTFKFLKGEYPYLTKYINNWDFVEDSPLTRKDALIVSAPFSATGNLHPKFYETIEEANNLDIPVLVDCAFFGITRNLKLNLNYRCIKSVAFSMSKAFCAGVFRAGIEFSKQDGGPAAIQNEWIYVQLLTAKICLEAAKKYSPDYIPTKYHNIQKFLCEFYNLKASDTIIFGLGDDKYENCNIDKVVNRCCLTPTIKFIIDHGFEV